MKITYCGICKKECSKDKTFYGRPVHEECLEGLSNLEALKLCFGLKKQNGKI